MATNPSVGLSAKIKETIKRYRMIETGDKVVVAVSGGPDSVALLYTLNNLKKELKFTLHIAHLDHMLRPDSYKDRAYVQGLAFKLKLPVTSGQINVKELANRGSMEEIARNARLGFLCRTAKNLKADKIALGHNLDDQAETVLMRILRGTGLYGLSGIMPKRNICGYQIIRPLIEVKRKQIEAFLKKRKIRPRTDVSNKENIYFRNRVRNSLLPLLEKKYNKNAKEVLASLAEIAGSDYDYLNKVAKRVTQGRNNRIVLGRFVKLHTAIQRLVIRNVIACVKGDTRRITFQHIREIEDLVSYRPINSIVDLPKGLTVVKKKNFLVFYLRKKT